MYLDDIIVYSSLWAENLKHLEEVLRRIETAGLTSQSKPPSKVCYCQEYQGYVIGGGVIKAQVQKLETIQRCPLPQSKTALLHFGLVSHYTQAMQM